jgi:hypothetical protein
MMQLSAAARELADQGRRVLPLVWTSTNGACSCGKPCSSPAKHPLLPHGLTDASSDPSKVRYWWERWPSANVGAVCDEHAVFDVDLPGLAKVLLAFPDVIETYPVRATPRGGIHIEVRATTASHPIFASSGEKLGDLKAQGGYVVMPPSRIGVRIYQAVNRVAPPAVDDVEGWLRELVGRAGVDLRPFATARPRDWVAHTLGTLAEGHRNVDLFAVAGRLRHAGRSPNDIFTLLEPHAERVQFPMDELDRLCQSAGRYPAGAETGGPIHVA